MANKDWLFYSQLYHHVAHWAAYMATLGLLIMSGVLLSTSSAPKSPCYVTFAIVLTWVGSIFFLLRMNTFGTRVSEKLEEAQKGAAEETLWKWRLLRPPRHLYLGGAVATVLAAWDLVVAWVR